MILLFAFASVSQEVDVNELYWKDQLLQYNEKPFTGVAVEYDMDGKAVQLEWYKKGTFTGKKRKRPNGQGEVWIEEKWKHDDLVNWKFIYPDDWEDHTPLFENNIDNPEFTDWFRRFKGALYSGDSVLVLNFFADTMSFGRYNCNEYVEYTDEEGNNYYGCTKKGMIGSYSYMGFEGFCQEALRQLEFGIGPDQGWYYYENEDEEIYSNMHFSDATFAGLFFGYEMSIVITNGANVMAEPTLDSEIIATHKEDDMLMGYVEIGCNGNYNDEEICWIQVQTDEYSGYMNSAEIIQGNYYLKFVFGKVNGEWKCTAIYQPPGC